MALARISITLPRDVVAAADRRAAELDRSRSWVVVEALRAYLSRPAGHNVSETAPLPYEVRQVADARRRHLESDLSLPPAERLRRAEELGRLARRGRRGGTSRRYQIIGFDSYEDFHEWKKGRLAGA